MRVALCYDPLRLSLMFRRFVTTRECTLHVPSESLIDSSQQLTTSVDISHRELSIVFVVCADFILAMKFCAFRDPTPPHPGENPPLPRFKAKAPFALPPASSSFAIVVVSVTIAVVAIVVVVVVVFASTTTAAAALSSALVWSLALAEELPNGLLDGAAHDETVHSGRRGAV